MINATPVRLIFKTLLDGMEQYAENVTNTAKKFRTDYTAAAKSASIYKDEKKILSHKRTELATAARAEIARFGAELGEVIAGCAKDMNDCLENALCKPVPAATEKLINLYGRYNLPMSKNEVEAALIVNGGHIGGLRLIDAMLRESNSPYVLKFTSVEQYAEDISELAKFAIMAEYTPCFPMEYLPEAKLIFCGSKETVIKPAKDAHTTGRNGPEYGQAGDVLQTNILNAAARVYRYQDGKAVETMQDMDQTMLTIYSTEYGSLLEKIIGKKTEDQESIGIAQRWCGDMAPAEERKLNYENLPEPISCTTIVSSEEPALKLAAEMGAEAARRNGPVSMETMEANGMK